MPWIALLIKSQKMINPYIIAALLLTGFSSGYYLRNLQAETEKVAILEAEREKLAKVRKINDHLLTTLAKNQAKTKIVYKTIVKEVPKYVTKVQKTDSDCNISIGTKRLLNKLIRPMPEAGIESINSDRQPSPIREVDLIEYLTSTINQYKIAQNRCNTLIQWHKQVQE